MALTAKQVERLRRRCSQTLGKQTTKLKQREQ